MSIKQILPIAGLTLTLALLPGLAADSAGAKTYKVDPVHSSAIYRIKHLNVSYSWGRFNDISGAITWDEANPQASSFDVQIKTESIDSNNEKRDNHLKGPDFFNAKQFPTIAFKSQSVKKTGEHMYDLTGELTLHGVTKPITAKLEHTGSGNNRGKSLAGFESTFNIKRSDFGMKFMVGPLSDDIRIIVSIEAAAE